MTKAGIKEARQHFTEYISKVEKGEEIIITKRAEPIAKITPIKKKVSGLLVSHKGIRSSIVPRGKPLSRLVTKSRRGSAGRDNLAT
jgi:prevent-host-death family protein